MSKDLRRSKDRRVNTPSSIEAEKAKPNASTAAEKAKTLADAPMNHWQNEINQSDIEMSRGQEDLITHLIEDHGYGNLIHPILKAKWLAKRAIRARSPR